MIVLPRDQTQKQKPSWRGPIKREGGLSAFVTCSNGHIASISGHEIAGDGRVSPSLICPYENCDFHEFVQLDGWEPCEHEWLRGDEGYKQNKEGWPICWKCGQKKPAPTKI